MRRFVPLVLLLALPVPVAAQPALQSEHLADPARLVEYVDTNARFWLGVFDADDGGGFFTNVDREGNVNSGWGRNKNVMTQSRDAYAMARAFQLTGDEAFLDYARGALNFMYAHGWDTPNGGWFDRLGETGTPLNPNDPKTAFHQHYALLGPFAMVEATDSALDLDWFAQGYAWNEDHLWDARPDLFGYYDRVGRSGAGATGKSFNATVDALTTHAIQLYLRTGDPAHRARLEQLAANMRDRLVASMDDQAIGFAEKYDSNWVPLASERLTIMGHVLKTAWCLARLADVLEEPIHLALAEEVAQHVLDRGYDHDLGGPYKDYDRVTGEMQLWGLQDTTKAWWQMEQAVTAGLELYRQTGRQQWLDMADETTDFFMAHFQDPVYGEVYADVTRYGDTIPQWGNLFKGDGNKAAYHSIELGYYAYLHATLFVHADEATLHYRFDAAPEARTIRLRPLDVSDGTLRLTRVLLDGQPYTDYDAAGLALNLPAGVGGHFEVGFEATMPVAAEPVAAPTAFALEAPAPNPFAGRTRLTYTLDRPMAVRLSVFDLLGREVAVLAEGAHPAGRHTVTLDGGALPAGVYLVRLATPQGTYTQRVTHLGR